MIGLDMLDMLIGSLFTLVILGIGVALGYALSNKESVNLKNKLTKAKHSLKVKNQKSEILPAITPQELAEEKIESERKAVGRILGEDFNDMSNLR